MRKCLFSAGEQCGKAICKKYEECSNCGKNGCNTYTCDKPTKSCVVNCLVAEFKCVCIEKYHRETPNGPCVALRCPPKPPSE